MLYRTPLCLLLALAAFCATAQAPVRTGRDYAVFFPVNHLQYRPDITAQHRDRMPADHRYSG